MVTVHGEAKPLTLLRERENAWLGDGGRAHAGVLKHSSRRKPGGPKSLEGNTLNDLKHSTVLKGSATSQ